MNPDQEILIVGAGFAGLGMALRLRKAGNRDFVILEQASEVGGTWRDNTYPGCACDIPSHLYSLSGAPSADWTRMYPTQPEILAYTKKLVVDHDLLSHIRFHATVREARFDEAAAIWRVETIDGRVFTARHLIMGLGALNRPAYPDIPGLERFRGRAFHTWAWDHDYDLTGKRVAVIGTGASVIQLVPQIAPKVAELHLFQRTPPWILPKLDRAIPDWERRLMRVFPPYRWFLRARLYWRQELLAFGFLGKGAIRAGLARMAKAKLISEIPDPTFRARVTPDYEIGCKRVLIANDYYPALQRDNVRLVTDRIVEITDNAVVTEGGVVHPVDALIYGTGFKATEILTELAVYGRGGASLKDFWGGAPAAYLGTTIPGFPNLFVIGGPNTGLGHNSVIFMHEAQIAYVMSCLDILKRSRRASIEVEDEVYRRFERDVQARLGKTVWLSGCRSWYLDSHGRNTTLWPGFTVEFWWRTRRAAAGEYRLTGPAG
jgi:cation diffusion facilitator CzcD-associated flavoprotein CzcO